MKSIKILLKSFFFITIILSSYGYSEIVNKIEIIGNDRISNETIKLFIPIKIKDEINDVKLNQILKELYDTEYFKDVSVKFENKTLLINVIRSFMLQSSSATYTVVCNKMGLMDGSSNLCWLLDATSRVTWHSRLVLIGFSSSGRLSSLPTRDTILLMVWNLFFLGQCRSLSFMACMHL